MLGGLLRASHLMAWEDMLAQVGSCASEAGIHDLGIYLSDLQEDVLRPLPDDGGHWAEGKAAEGRTAEDAAAGGQGDLSVATTMAGRSFQLGRVFRQTEREQPGVLWWVPLLDGTERLGVLRAVTAADDESTRDELDLLAALVALLVVSKRGSSDTHARLVRTRPMNVAAEMQWHLMPPATYADPRVVVGGVLEPAYEIGGDAFDYARAGDVLHLGIFDAMGHDTSAGVTANLAVAACRSNRRQGLGLIETSVAIEEILLTEFHRRRYVTAILADLDTVTGGFSWVNRGHHPPVVIRGGRWMTRLQCPPAHPMGTDLGLEPVLCREQLEPGDRVVLYTDGITEARNADGREFGLEGFVDFLIRHHSDGLPVPETLRRLMRAIMAHHGGRLADDATVLVVEWLGPEAGPSLARDRVGLPMAT
ncbi:PP2C family protein-serine/threonine phosphatase [Streptomyces sp. G-G2]|nr:PP2C family protein-serine/threonine phosphatase [Streptomyces sp. G-G2]MDJ0385614.1 PP2C family protein-serine/threonine phosphatase [Streptomyces sp. G-G2]